jgi:hypothetical protein
MFYFSYLYRCEYFNKKSLRFFLLICLFEASGREECYQHAIQEERGILTTKEGSGNANYKPTGRQGQLQRGLSTS